MSITRDGLLAFGLFLAAVLIVAVVLAARRNHQEELLTLNERSEESEGLVDWIVRFVDELEMSAKDQVRIAATCLNLAQYHHRAIVSNAKEAHLPSAFALARVELEAYIRGAWFHYCASDSDIEEFKRRDWLKKVEYLKDDLETHEAFSEGVLSGILENNWNAMNSFTHTGMEQIVRNSTETHFEPNYSEEEIVGLLNMADSTALLAVMGLVDLSVGEADERETRALCVLSRMEEFAAAGPARR